MLDPDDAAWFRDDAARSGLTLRRAFGRVRLAAGGDLRRAARDLAPHARELAARAAAVRRATASPPAVVAADATLRNARRRGVSAAATSTQGRPGPAGSAAAGATAESGVSPGADADLFGATANDRWQGFVLPSPGQQRQH